MSVSCQQAKHSLNISMVSLTELCSVYVVVIHTTADEEKGASSGF